MRPTQGRRKTPACGRCRRVTRALFPRFAKSAVPQAEEDKRSYACRLFRGTSPFSPCPAGAPAFSARNSVPPPSGLLRKTFPALRGRAAVLPAFREGFSFSPPRRGDARACPGTHRGPSGEHAARRKKSRPVGASCRPATAGRKASVPARCALRRRTKAQDASDGLPSCREGSVCRSPPCL